MVEIKPLDRCDAVVAVPSSKSYTHRALLISALADGESILLNPLLSEDTQYTIRGLECLGIMVVREGNALRLLGKGGTFRDGTMHILAGNSGTTMRFLTAFASLRHGVTVLDGSERMRQRPIMGLLEGLQALGVQARSENQRGYPPIVVMSDGLKGGVANIQGGISSQFVSALLIVSPYAEKDVHLKVTDNLASRSYVDITIQVMEAFGVRVERTGYRSFFTKAGQQYQPRSYRIEGDASSASYFFAAAAITQGKVSVENLCPNSVQGDVRFLDVLGRMGCEILHGDHGVEVRGRKLRGLEIDMRAVPDLVPTLAVTAAFAHGRTVIKNIGHLRLKESDRIASLVEGLDKMGIRTEAGKDWLAVTGGCAHGAEIETHDDHRLAMAFAVAGLVVPGIKIHGERCVEKSFPKFWEIFQRLYKNEQNTKRDPVPPVFSSQAEC